MTNKRQTKSPTKEKALHLPGGCIIPERSISLLYTQPIYIKAERKHETVTTIVTNDGKEYSINSAIEDVAKLLDWNVLPT